MLNGMWQPKRIEQTQRAQLHDKGHACGNLCVYTRSGSLYAVVVCTPGPASRRGARHLRSSRSRARPLPPATGTAPRASCRRRCQSRPSTADRLLRPGTAAALPHPRLPSKQPRRLHAANMLPPHSEVQASPRILSGWLAPAGRAAAACELTASAVCCVQLYATNSIQFIQGMPSSRPNLDSQRPRLRRCVCAFAADPHAIAVYSARTEPRTFRTLSKKPRPERVARPASLL